MKGFLAGKLQLKDSDEVWTYRVISVESRLMD